MEEDCCATQAPTSAPDQTRQPLTCPACQAVGKPVTTQLVQAMLAVSLRRVSSAAPYAFCAMHDCPVVYFAPDHHFRVDELREVVHQKRPDDDQAPVCYCFGYNPASIRAEWQATNQSTVVADITSGIQAGQCACEIRNPQGSCCLGNVRAVVKRVAGTVPASRVG